jgi:hypothetical protein
MYIGGPSNSFDIAIKLRAQRSGIESRWIRNFPPVHNAHAPTVPSVKCVTQLSMGFIAVGACFSPLGPSSAVVMEE